MEISVVIQNKHIELWFETMRSAVFVPIRDEELSDVICGLQVAINKLKTLKKED